MLAKLLALIAPPVIFSISVLVRMGGAVLEMASRMVSSVDLACSVMVIPPVSFGFPWVAVVAKGKDTGVFCG